MPINIKVEEFKIFEKRNDSPGNEEIKESIIYKERNESSKNEGIKAPTIYKKENNLPINEKINEKDIKVKLIKVLGEKYDFNEKITSEEMIRSIGKYIDKILNEKEEVYQKYKKLSEEYKSLTNDSKQNILNGINKNYKSRNIDNKKSEDELAMKCSLFKTYRPPKTRKPTTNKRIKRKFTVKI